MAGKLSRELLRLVFGLFEAKSDCKRIEVQRFSQFRGADEILNLEPLVFRGRNHSVICKEVEEAFPYRVCLLF